jgi:hypothetical protein
VVAVATEQDQTLQAVQAEMVVAVRALQIVMACQEPQTQVAVAVAQVQLAGTSAVLVVRV